MPLKSQGYRRPKTSVQNVLAGCKKHGIKREKGSVQWSAGLFFILFMAVLLCAEIQLSSYQTTSLYLEDALAASNLASAIVDVEEYGISHKVVIEEPQEAYRRYRSAVQENLQLNENWECMNTSLISGKVTVEKYIIYNVDEDQILITSVLENGQLRESQGILGKVQAPNGIVVEKTGIYSEIRFPVKGFWQIEVEAHKGKLVDIVASFDGV